MIKYVSENKNCLTPSFISQALSGVTHRFVLVLECETRTDPSSADKNNGKVPPRFAIGGPRATIDPRNAKIDELLPLIKHRLELPHGWEKVHQYMYVLQPSTDEHGWQYRSRWSNGPLGEGDEPWVKNNQHGLDARRRLWITTVVRQDDLMTSKKKLEDNFKAKARGVIMLGELYRQESGTLRKIWQKRFCVLTDTKIEVYASSGGKKIRDVSLADCDIKMLFGVQCPGRDYAFSIRENNGNLVGLFDAESREVRRRWVVAIRYQLAIHHSDANFPPFDYGPPTGDDLLTRVLMCGELQKQGQSVKNWKNRFFQLTPIALQYFDKEALKGELILIGAVVSDTEKSGPLDFAVTSAGGAGRKLVMRADTLSHKATWLRAIQRQVSIQTEKAEAAKKEGGGAQAEPTVFKTPAPMKPEPEPEVETAEPDPDVVDEPTAEVTEMIRKYTIVDGPPLPEPIPAEWNETETKNAQVADEELTEELEEELINQRNSAGRKNSVAMVTSSGELFLADASEGPPVPQVIVQESEISEDVFQGLMISDDAQLDENGEAVLSAGHKLVPKAREKELDPEADEDLIFAQQVSIMQFVNRNVMIIIINLDVI